MSRSKRLFRRGHVQSVCQTPWGKCGVPAHRRSRRYCPSFDGPGCYSVRLSFMEADGPVTTGPRFLRIFPKLCGGTPGLSGKNAGAGDALSRCLDQNSARVSRANCKTRLQIRCLASMNFGNCGSNLDLGRGWVAVPIVGHFSSMRQVLVKCEGSLAHFILVVYPVLLVSPWFSSILHVGVDK